jgi:ribose-phosphate pyrophosphokinase
MIHYQIEMPNDRGRKYESITYPGGERQIRLLPSEFDLVRKADVLDVVAQIQSGNEPIEITDVALLVTALGKFIKRSRVNGEILAKRNLILPYLPYARADRHFQDGDCFGLKAFAVLVNSLEFDNVIAYDVHSEVAFRLIYNLQEKSIARCVKEAIDLIGKRGLTIILPDKGAERYRPLLAELGIKRIAVGGKVRDPRTGKLSGFSFPPVRIKKGLIIDDICDGGGTFLGLAGEIKRLNPKARLSLYTTHGIYSQGIEKLKAEFEHVFSTGTFRNGIIKTEVKS